MEDKVEYSSSFIFDEYTLTSSVSNIFHEYSSSILAFTPDDVQSEFDVPPIQEDLNQTTSEIDFIRSLNFSESSNIWSENESIDTDMNDEDTGIPRDDVADSHITDAGDFEENEFDIDLKQTDIELMKNIRQMLSGVCNSETPAFLLRSRGDPKKIRKISLKSKRSNETFQMVYHILKLIHRMLMTNSFATKRDIFYKNVNLFRNQQFVDRIVDDLVAHFQCPRINLHIIATSKGLIHGNCVLKLKDNTELDASTGGNNQGHLIPNIEEIDGFSFPKDLKFVLVIEKAATFSHLISIGFCDAFGPCLMVTGKGYPDLNTKEFLSKISVDLSKAEVPMIALVDCDPHGIDIYKVYKYGSESNPINDATNLSELKSIGVHTKDWSRYHVSVNGLIPLTHRDARKASCMMKKRIFRSNKALKCEISRMLWLNYKTEIQALYMTDDRALFDLFEHKLKLRELWL